MNRGARERPTEGREPTDERDHVGGAEFEGPAASTTDVFGIWSNGGERLGPARFVQLVTDGPTGRHPAAPTHCDGGLVCLLGQDVPRPHTDGRGTDGIPLAAAIRVQRGHASATLTDSRTSYRRRGRGAPNVNRVADW